MKIRTHLDTNILIAAFQGQTQRIVDKIYCILDDPEREFIGSDFLRLELLPKPTFYKKQSDPFALNLTALTASLPIRDK